MQEVFSSYRTSRLLYAAADLYNVETAPKLYATFENLLLELLGHSNFTLFFPFKADHRLKVVHSTFPREEDTEPWQFDLDSPLLSNLLKQYQEQGMMLNGDAETLALLPFPATSFAVLKDDQVMIALLVIHEGINEELCDPFPIVEVLEPMIKHFNQALMHLKSNDEVEKSLNESNAKLLAINEIGEFMGQLDLSTLLSKIMGVALQLVRAEVGNLMILNKDNLITQVEWGLNDKVVRGITWRDNSPLVERVLERCMPVLVEDLRGDKRFLVAEGSRSIHSILSIPLYSSSKSLGVLNVVNTSGGDSFSPVNLATLQTVAGLASTAVENATLHREAIDREIFQEHLRIARQIWENILPKKVPRFPGVLVAARSVPAAVVGGDFYDFILLDENRLGLVIADVSGKGIPAAMIMNMAKSILHIEALKGEMPHEVLNIVNDQLVESTKLDSFVTLVYLVLNRATHKVHITNAGHNPVMIYRQQGNLCEEIHSDDMPLAIVPNQKFSFREIDFRPGDSIVLYTDGVTEAMNTSGKMFEGARLKKLIKEIGNLETADEMLEKIYAEITDFVGEASQHDDITVLVIKYLET